MIFIRKTNKKQIKIRKKPKLWNKMDGEKVLCSALHFSKSLKKTDQKKNQANFLLLAM
jgi:predicted transposase YbfD/YdcC